MAKRKPTTNQKPTTKAPAAPPKREVPSPSPAAAFPFNRNKAAEHGRGAAPVGRHVDTTREQTAGTRTETTITGKTRSGPVQLGGDAMTGSLDRARVDGSGHVLTTDQGVPIADNQNSLKAGLRGPTLMEDFILREKITHFDHERIPERVVHARGSAAHGYFECYRPLGSLTRASIFAEAGKRTPVFVRFSTVAGERGSSDLARDVRGFAVKFYTDEGNWDLVGNNIPVFFIQDAMKFPDLIHAVKPEPHHGMPQAASAHDTFWDFVSLTPESTHTLMWAMSDRAIPRSLRMMQGFGVHTFRFVNERGQSKLVKFHFTPKQGTCSLVWDEAVRLSGIDPDFHRRDLWESIESGAFPEWEMGVQVFTEQEGERFSFDFLDPTKLVPEELVPVTPIGRLVLNANPDNFFAETEQVAFCAAHVVPGIDFTNDPLLAGRIHSYMDTQISRLGGANFHEIPINAPVAPVHNHQRDGLHRQAIVRGRVAYEPSSLGGGCPHQAGSKAGFTSFPQRVSEDHVRGKPAKFAEHFQQATLFWNSQSPAEQSHIVSAFRFELGKVETIEVRTRVLSQLRNVSDDLAGRVAKGLGMSLPEPMPSALDEAPEPEVTRSPPLSLMARPSEIGIATRRVAILVADGVDTEGARAMRSELEARGAVARFVGPRLGEIAGPGRTALAIDTTFDASPAPVWDAVIVADGAGAADALSKDGAVHELLTLTHRHGKPMMFVGSASRVLEASRVPTKLPSGGADAFLLVRAEPTPDDDVGALAKVLAKHRTTEREVLV